MKTLKFIHITKTGGTSIEQVGIMHNIRWGRYHAEYGSWFHEKFRNKPRWLRIKYDWFTVVRNPYNRIISEYHWCMKNDNIRETSVEQLNTFICKSINQMLILKEDSFFCNKPRYIRSIGGHFTEQHMYIDRHSTIHIIKYEKLKEEFNNLMIRYRLKVRLNVYCNKSIKMYTIKDLYPETIDLIKNIYIKDFNKFGYSTDPKLA
jgi:hypothetical protein